MRIDDLYDQIEQAPLLKPELDVTFSGRIVKIDEARQTKYETVPALTLRLDTPTDDGDDYGVLLLGSDQLKRVIAKAAKRAGRNEITLGDWVSASVVEKRETSNGNTMNWWAADYKAAPDDVLIGLGGLEDADKPAF